MTFHSPFRKRIRFLFSAGIIILYFLLLSPSSARAEILCSFRISSVSFLQKLCSNPSSSILGACLSATIRNQSSSIPYEFFNSKAPVYGAFISVPEKTEYHFILLFPLTSSKKTITAPQNYFSKTIEDYYVFSLSSEALSQGSNQFFKIKNIFKDTREDISVFCSVRETWGAFKATAQLLRGLFLMTQSSGPEEQKLNFHLFEFGFFLLDSLDEIKISLNKDLSSQNHTFYLTLKFIKDSPINELFPQKPSFDLSEKLSCPDPLFRLAFNPLKVKESAFRILDLLQSRMGFKPEDISGMKNNLTDFLGTKPVSGLFLLDCTGPSQNSDSSFIRIQQENLPLNLEMLSQKLQTLIQPFPFILNIKTAERIPPEKNISAELCLTSAKTPKTTLPPLLTHAFNQISPENSLLDFSFREKDGILYGTLGKDSFQNFNPVFSFQGEKERFFSFLQIRIKYSDFRNLYLVCFSSNRTTLSVPEIPKDTLELTVLFYYNEKGLHVSLTLPNPLLEMPL